MTDTCDRIGATCNVTRRPDPRIAKAIWSALADCCSVLNVGAGTGAYKPADRTVVAVEPLRQDLSDGTWAARHHALMTQTELDCGYRIVVGVHPVHLAPRSSPRLLPTMGQRR